MKVCVRIQDQLSIYQLRTNYHCVTPVPCRKMGLIESSREQTSALKTKFYMNNEVRAKRTQAFSFNTAEFSINTRHFPIEKQNYQDVFRVIQSVLDRSSFKPSSGILIDKIYIATSPCSHKYSIPAFEV